MTGAGLRETRGSLSVGHSAKGSCVRASWWHLDLAPDWNISSAPLPASTPVPPLSSHLLMIEVPVVYNYQFDKFRSSLLIIIISFHSV